MALERTLSIVKPDAVKKNTIGGVLDKLERGGLKVIATRMTRLSKAQAEAFYAVHKQRPFYGSLVEFMTSGPVVVSVLEGDNAVLKNREIMGATDPGKAAEGTIRKAYGANIEHNAVHGSDSLDNAKIEVAFFFAASELE
ncbi:MAG: nucleoside-diphosphate kinase [Deltaproteobacteria bacterium]|nr:nucleoside-diphosphate kinase [Deltaproteobacteria bacterium]